MTTFIKSLFGTRKNDTTNTAATAENITAVTPDLNLFVDEQHPEASNKKTGNGFGRLKTFLHADYYTDGLAIGYQTHSEAGMQLYLKDLKSRFRLEANALEELLGDMILRNKKQIIDVGEMLPNIKAQLQIDIDHDEKMLEELRYQKMMSEEGEGWVSSVLYAFEKGYRKGMLDYLSLGTFSTRGIL
jgi:hypothetical protein